VIEGLNLLTTWRYLLCGVIANLAVDAERKFDAIFERYYGFLGSEYMVTVANVVAFSDYPKQTLLNRQNTDRIIQRVKSPNNIASNRRMQTRHSTTNHRNLQHPNPLNQKQKNAHRIRAETSKQPKNIPKKGSTKFH
jgi:hypothetical protein